MNKNKVISFMVGEKISRHLWQKIKALFLGQWLQKRHMQHSEEVIISYTQDEVNQFVLHDWIQAIDILSFLVQSVRKNCDTKSNYEIDLEVLGANTYLFHVDRLLAKIREHF